MLRMDAMTRKLRPDDGSTNRLNPNFATLVLAAFSIFFVGNTLAASKPGIQVRFEMDRLAMDQRRSNVTYLDDTARKKVIDLVCQESRKRWGFLEWCGESGDEASQAIWTVRLVIEPRERSPDNQSGERVLLNHFLQPTPNDETRIDLKERSAEMYSYFGPKWSDETELLRKIISTLKTQFDSQVGWVGANKYLRTIPIANDLVILEQSQGGKKYKFISIPFRYCDLALERGSTFKVTLDFEPGTIDEFYIQSIGELPAMESADSEDVLKFIQAKVSDWNVNSLLDDPEPFPTSKKYISSDVEEVLQSHAKNVFVEMYDIGPGCAVSNGLVLSLNNDRADNPGGDHQ